MLELGLGLSTFIYIYLGFKLLDFVLGICKAFHEDNFDTKVMRQGIVTWIGEVSCIALLVLLDNVFAMGNILVGSTISLFVFKEYNSITRNLQALGIQVPNVVDITIKSLFSGTEKDE